MAGETTLGTAQIPIRATLDELDRDLDGARSKVEGALNAIQAAGKAALALGAIGLGAVATSLFAGIKGAMEEEMVFTNLEATLKSVGIAADKQAAEYQAAQGKITTSSAMSAGALSDLKDKYRLTEIAIANQQSIVDSLTAHYGTANTATEAASIKLRQMQGALSDLGAQMQAGGRIIQTSLADTLGLVPPVARMTFDEIVKLGDKLSRTTLFTHEQINTVDAMLLTFTHISKDIFPEATVAVANLGQKFGSLDSASIQVGKALQDPISGVTALRRVGVMLTDQQEKQIKKFVEQGDIVKAQKIILGELETEFGGLAEAMGKTATGKMTILKHTFDEMLETVGANFIPIISTLADKALPLLDNALAVIAPIAKIVGDSLGTFVKNLQLGINPITAFQILLTQLLPPAMVTTLMGIVAGVRSFLKSIKPTIDQVTAWLSQNVQLKDVLIAVGIAIASVVIPAILGVVATMAPIIAAFVALVAIVALVRRVWETNWGGIRTTLTAFWEGTAKPALAQLWAWLQVKIPAAIQTLSGFWMGTLVPALDKALSVIVPIAKLIGDSIGTFFKNLQLGINPITAFQILLTQLFPPGMVTTIMDIVAGIQSLFTAFQTGDFKPFLDKLNGLSSKFWDWIFGPGGVLETAGGNLGRLVSSISNLLVTNWPTISAKLGEWGLNFWNWLTGPGGVLGQAGAKIGELVLILSAEVIKGWPTVSAKLSEWGTKFWNWLTEPGGAIETATTKLDGLVNKFVEWVNSGTTQARINDIGKSLGGNLVTSLETSTRSGETSARLTILLGNLLTLVNDLLKAQATVIKEIGGGLASGLIDGIVSKIKTEGPAKVGQALLDLVGPVLMGGALTTEGRKNIQGVGASLIDGLKQGFAEKSPEFYAELGTTANNSVGSMADLYGAHSPSTVFAAIGADLVAGLAMGWTTASAGLIPTMVTSMGTLVGQIQSGLPTAIQTSSDSLTTTLLTALTSVWTFIQTNIFPMLTNLCNWLQITVPAAIQTLADFLNTVLLLAITAVYDFISISVMPQFQALADLLNTVVDVAIQTVATTLNTMFAPAIKAIWDFIDKNLIPIFKVVADVVRVTLGGAFQWVSDNVLKPFAGVLGWIGGLIEDTIDAIRRLKSALGSVKVPGALSPGSPSPFELALRGIREEMDALAGMSVPSLSVSLERASSAELAPRGGELSAAPSRQQITIYGLTLNGVQNVADLLGQLQAVA
jgi:hypothetical protein